MGINSNQSLYELINAELRHVVYYIELDLCSTQTPNNLTGDCFTSEITG